LASREIKDLALDRMNSLQTLILTQSQFSRTLPNAIASPANSYNSRDPISGVAQYLPTSPIIESIVYKKITRQISEYFRSLHHEISARHDILASAYKAFFEIDAGTTHSNAEHELTRCFLYLAYPRQSGDLYAFNH